jgi:hypothetical protein
LKNKVSRPATTDESVKNLKQKYLQKSLPEGAIMSAGKMKGLVDCMRKACGSLEKQWGNTGSQAAATTIASTFGGGTSTPPPPPPPATTGPTNTAGFFTQAFKRFGKAEGQGDRFAQKTPQIGSTRSGKPIFNRFDHPSHASFDYKDHMDAMKAHSTHEGGSTHDIGKHFMAAEGIDTSSLEEGKPTAFRPGKRNLGKAVPTPTPTPAPDEFVEGTDPVPVSGTNVRMGMSDEPHSPGSPEDAAHDIVEEGERVPEVVNELPRNNVDDMFGHLRMFREQKNAWVRSPANRAAGAENTMHKSGDLEKKQGVPKGVDLGGRRIIKKEVKKDPDVDNPYAVCGASLQKMRKAMRVPDDAGEGED